MATVWIEDGRIQRIDRSEVSAIPADYEIINAEGNLLIPGMMDGTIESIYKVSKTCLQTGCTSFLITSVTSSIEQLLQIIRNVKKAIGHEPGERIEGIHASNEHGRRRI